MKKQRRRIYAALLCSSMVLSLVSTPVSAAETGQLTNPPTSTEELSSPESISGNEAAAILNGLYAALPVANGVKEVATAEELTAALADSSVVKITLAENIYIGSTLTVNRAVTLDLNGNVLKMNGSGSVIRVESGGNLTIQDSNTSTPHKFTRAVTAYGGWTKPAARKLSTAALSPVAQECLLASITPRAAVCMSPRVLHSP